MSKLTPETMSNIGAKELIRGIFHQSVKDYYKPRHKQNVVDFLQSEWAEDLYAGLTNGRSVLSSPKQILADIQDGRVDKGALLTKEE